MPPPLAFAPRPRAGGLPRRGRRPAALAGLLASCGGGGDAGSDPFGIGLPDADTLDQQCAAAPGDRPGSVADEKAWVRAYIDETYLWYQDVRALPAAPWTRHLRDAAGVLRRAEMRPLTSLGQAEGPVPLHLRHADLDRAVEIRPVVRLRIRGRVAVDDAAAPGASSPSRTREHLPPPADIARGAQILTVDGVDLVNGSTQAGIDALNAGLFPSAAGNHTFTIRDLGAATTRSVTLAAGTLTSTPVQNVKTLPAPNNQRRLPAVQRPHRHVGGAADRRDRPAEDRRRDRPRARHPLQRRRLPRHRERAGLHGRRAGTDRRQGLRATELQRPNPFGQTTRSARRPSTPSARTSEDADATRRCPTSA